MQNYLWKEDSWGYLKLMSTGGGGGVQTIYTTVRFKINFQKHSN